MELYIIKRKGHAEYFDERKLYASIYSAALNCHKSEEESEKIADETSNNVKKWLHYNPTTKSHKLKVQVIKELKEIDKDIAMMYEVHLDLC